MVIGVGKLLKAATLVVLGVAFLTLVGESPTERVTKWAEDVGLRPGSGVVHRAIVTAAGLDAHKLKLLAAALFLYAVLFTIEGGGLLAKKRWAEYFTIVITGSFLPIEIYELVHRASVGKVVALVLNLTVLGYLAWHVRREKHPAHRSMPFLGYARRP